MTESIWRPDLDWGHIGRALTVISSTELPALTWARSLKGELVALQQETGGRITAAGAVTQFLHESADPGGRSLSRLALEYCNLAGIKWVGGWQLRHGARPVSLSTWEELDGDRTDLVDAFAAFPSVGHFLGAYSELLQFDRYRRAHAYADQPLLWLHQVWAGGWATDSRYLGGLGHWMVATWPIYRDTLPAAPADPRGQKVEILDAGGNQLATGWLMDPDGPGPEGYRTVARVVDLAAGLGMTHRWNGGRPAVTLLHPGMKKEENHASDSGQP